PRAGTGTTSPRAGTGTTSQSFKPRRSSSRRSVPPERFSILDSISPERKMDILGVGMAILGLLTLLSLFSANKSGLTSGWISMLAQFFGWGVYILPVGLIVLGTWLVARNVDRLPALNIERVIGMLLLFVGLLVTFHGIDGPTATAIARAQAGHGGGYIGALLQRGLVGAIDVPGTAIVVVAWLVIALAMTLDLSMQEMFKWAGPLGAKLKDRLNQWLQRQAHRPTGSQPMEEPLDEFTPLQPPPLAQLASAAPLGVTVKTNLPSTPAITWVLPKVGDILEPPEAPKVNEEFIQKRARLIEETLASFGAPSQVIEISRGPTVTMFGVEPLFVESRTGQTRVRVGKIASLADDLALALAAPRIRIQAPVPGRGFVGIEVPNEEMALVALREVVESEVFTRNKAPLRFALGKDVAGHPKAANLDSMPHMLIAGTTGSGKSVCVNAILSCLLLNNTPDDLRLILVDPKRVELTGYNGIPHLLAPVVVEIERVVGALQWMTREMDNRYHKFAEIGARNIADYNVRMASQGGRKLPYLLVVIDELADLMMIAPDETERTITRLAQLARATGIHMIIATQRPSVDVVTGLIKANFPARIAFAVASNTDSRVILDQPGAERLLGRGDMLFQAPDSPAPVRLQGVFVSDIEITRLVDYWKQQAGASSPYAAAAGTSGGTAGILPQGAPLASPNFGGRQVPMFEDITALQGDPLLNDAIDTVRREGRASVSMLQRRMRIGYTRAARLVDTMEEKGIVGRPESGTGVREVLDYGPAAPPKED
ncbi:MAG: DNA translocase FtsK 4TM domain-containing protein, partial [Candidatus Atribacteria bacterium]|nr:DNA translocase FtsK 4TM domain-containing protein [Candidatus Atribacteria bacterium]